MDVFLPEAREEFEQAMKYLEQQALGFGERFRGEVLEAIRQVLNEPEGGSWYENGFKYRSVARFPYIVIYAHREEQTIVVAVMHTSRRPGYWKSRLKD